jgi:hypothetical protein
MINLIVFISLLGVIFLNYLILSKLNNTLSLRNSVLFFVNALMAIVLIEWFISITSLENLSNALGVDKLIAFNSAAIRVRNTVILVSLFYLSYGTYREYRNKKSKALLITSCVLIALSIVYLVTVLVAGAFII